MTPRARSFALRAAAKVALAAAAGCERPEPQPVTAQTVPAGPGATPQALAPPIDAAVSSPSTDTTDTCVVQNVDAPTAAELACCDEQLAPDGDKGATYSSYARAQSHAGDAGTAPTTGARACCEAFFNASDHGAQADIVATANADWGRHRWGCCTAFVADKVAPSMVFARCTPWGPPVPPPMDWA
jgi:hypothetical protein